MHNNKMGRSLTYLILSSLLFFGCGGGGDDVANPFGVDFSDTPNTAPIANAGVDQAVVYTERAIIDGTGSTDADGDSLTYDWSFYSFVPSSPAFVQISFFDVSPGVKSISIGGGSFTGTARMQLIVNDGTTDSLPDYVDITFY